MIHVSRVLTVIVLVVVVAACAGRRAGGSAVVSDNRSQEPWFCETAEASTDWHCERDAERAAQGRPSRLPPRQLAATTAPPEPKPQPVDPEEPAEDVSPSPRQPPQASTPQQVKPTDDRPTYQRLAYQPEGTVLLSELPPEFYAVQLIAMSSQSALEAWVEQHKLSGFSAALVESNGERFLVLLLGVYEDYERAQRAAESRPASLADTEPWIRSMANLQRAMVPIEDPR